MRQHRSITTALLVAHEDERVRLARELHDGAMQQVIALVHRVDRMNCLIERGDSDRALELAQAVRQVLASLAGELRSVISNLRPPALEEFGLLRAVAMLVGRPGDEAPSVSVQVEGTERRLTPESELAIFRIVQEGWSNILRHARAQHVAITFQYMRDQIVVIISDDGVGFAVQPDPDLPDGHWGLRGMHERAALVGGAITVVSEPDCGTSLTLQIPIHACHLLLPPIALPQTSSRQPSQRRACANVQSIFRLDGA